MNKKGMASMIDAMIFITVMTMVVGMMFPGNIIHDSDETKAGEVCENLMSVGLSMGEVYGTDDSIPVKLADLIAGYLRTGDGDVTDYIKKAMGVLVPGYNYLLVYEYENKILKIGEEYDEETSSYFSSVTVMGGGVLNYRLSLYG